MAKISSCTTGITLSAIPGQAHGSDVVRLYAGGGPGFESMRALRICRLYDVSERLATAADCETRLV